MLSVLGRNIPEEQRVKSASDHQTRVPGLTTNHRQLYEQQRNSSGKIRTARRFLNKSIHSTAEGVNISEMASAAKQKVDQRANEIVRCLRHFGIAVVDNFIGQPFSKTIKEQAVGYLPEMEEGQTLESNDTSQPYRLDRVKWVTGQEKQSQLFQYLLRNLDYLMNRVSSKLPEYQIEGRTQAMLACYRGNGAKYVRHVDNPYRDGRLLTCIYYLNDGWTKEDGGLLKIYPNGQTRMATIEPALDRLLIFWSDCRSPHEVMPTHRDRFAVTVWYFDKCEREAAIHRLQRRKENVTSDTKDKSDLPPKSQPSISTETDSEDEDINVVDVEPSQASVSFCKQATPKIKL